jgi:hypothetical protein
MNGGVVGMLNGTRGMQEIQGKTQQKRDPKDANKQVIQPRATLFASSFCVLVILAVVVGFVVGFVAGLLLRVRRRRHGHCVWWSEVQFTGTVCMIYLEGFHVETPR